MRRIATIVLLAAALAGCSDGEEDDVDVKSRTEAKAVETRQHVDDLVARLGGTAVEVVGDDIIDCDPQDPDAGLLFNYSVRFTAPEGADDVLRGTVADALEAEGWTVRREPANERESRVRFLRDSFSMGASLSVRTTAATAGGSSGCVT